MIGITQQVRQWLRQGTPAGRIAVIYKEHKYGEELPSISSSSKFLSTAGETWIFWIAACEKIDPPFEMARFRTWYFLQWWWNAFDTPLRLVWDRPIEIAKLMEVADKNTSGAATFYPAITDRKRNAPTKDLFSSNIPEALKNASVILEKLLSMFRIRPCSNYLKNIIRGAGCESSQSPDKHWELQVSPDCLIL